MSMREDRADLRARVFRGEREKRALEAAVGELQAKAVALAARVGQLQMEIKEKVWD